MIIMKENKLRITLTSLASRENWAKNERTIKGDKHEAKSIMWHSGWYTIFNDSMSGQFPTAERTSANIKPLLLEVSECVSKNNFGLYSQFPVILRFSFKTEKSGSLVSDLAWFLYTLDSEFEKDSLVTMVMEWRSGIEMSRWFPVLIEWYYVKCGISQNATKCSFISTLLFLGNILTSIHFPFYMHIMLVFLAILSLISISQKWHKRVFMSIPNNYHTISSIWNSFSAKLNTKMLFQL